MLLLAAESRAEGRVVSAEGRKTAFPLQNPSLLDPTVFNRIQPAIRCINILFFICVYIYIYIHDTPVKGLEKTTGMKVFQMLCLLDRKKGVDGLLGLRRRFRDE